jgi:hypothetical protein
MLNLAEGWFKTWHWHGKLPKEYLDMEVDQAVAKKESHHCGDSEGIWVEFC